MTIKKLTESELAHMKKLALAATEKAYAPYSKFLVGTCLKTSAGNYYAGCNIENASYSLTLCAEACAISHMVVAGDQAIEGVVIVSSGDEYCFPCGACRQMLREFSSKDCWVYMFNAAGKFQERRLSELLPDSFGPGHLGV